MPQKYSNRNEIPKTTMKLYSRNWTVWAKSKLPSFITVTYKIKDQQQLSDKKLKATYETQK